MLVALSTLLLTSSCSVAFGASSLEFIELIAQTSFAKQAPTGWHFSGPWVFAVSGAGVLGHAEARASRVEALPEHCIVELLVDLPKVDGQSQTSPMVSLGIGRPADAEEPDETSDVSLTVRWSGEDGYRMTMNVRDQRIEPNAVHWVEAETEAADKKSPAPVSLAIAIGRGRVHGFVNGSHEALFLSGDPDKRHVTVRAAGGVVVRAARVLDGLPEGFLPVSGAGVGFRNNARSLVPGGPPSDRGHGPQLVRLDCGGIPMIASVEQGSMAALDLSKENFKLLNKYRRGRPLGTGFLSGFVPTRPYTRAHLLFLADPEAEGDTVPAMGFGLRTINRGDVKNIYVSGDTRTNDQGVQITPIPDLGPNWYLASVDLNPAAMHWANHHNENGQLHPPHLHRVPFHVGRPLQNDQLPRHSGKDSSLRVVAVTFTESSIDLAVRGNGLGNVYVQPDEPTLTATVSNLGREPIQVDLTTELIPYEREPIHRKQSLQLAPGASREVSALAALIVDRGHYKVRVVADARGSGRSEWRTNVALLAPDTRQRKDGRFGIWPRLSGDRSTDGQHAYLKEKAGVDFLFLKHASKHRLFGIRGSPRITDAAVAERIAKGLVPEIKIVMFGWERNWSGAHASTIPSVITGGKPEDLSKQINELVDEVVEELKLFSAALRKFRPDVKISLGNTNVNWITPLLQRGIKAGVHFDYFGTEEGLFAQSPERPSNAYGNISWWARSVCEHFGFFDVPLFHSESVYFSTGPGFARISERNQAGWYVRTYLIGLAYDSVYGISGAIVDSSAGYIYSSWGMPGYCNQAPECSPKLSYVAYATMTQLLDGGVYDGKLDAGTHSIYGMRFRKADGTHLCALWNLRGRRRVTLSSSDDADFTVVDALNRPIETRKDPDGLSLVLGDLPTYVLGPRVERITPNTNVPELLSADWKRIAPLPGPSQWSIERQPDPAFGKPGKWGGVPRIRGNFAIIRPQPLIAPGLDKFDGIRISQDRHHASGLVPRYARLTLDASKTIAIPAGTTRLGLWVYGNDTWAEIKFRIQDAQGNEYIPLERDPGAVMADNFTGWRFLCTPYLNKFGTDIAQGGHRVVGLVVAMPEQHVYVDELVTTAHPWVAVSGVYVSERPDVPINYMPW